jgi:cytochrome P450
MPWLRHLPFFNTKFEHARRSPQEMRKLTSMSIKKHMDTFDEDHQRDFIDCYIKKMKETSDENSSFFKGHGEGNIQRTVMDLFGAGSETTSSVLTFAFNYLTRYPDMQEKIQAEIDTVIGSRMPLIEDRPQMPYTDAFIHEVLRHSCIIYTTPHATTEEVQFHGHTLPAGTSVYANVSWIMNDPEYWHNPEQFNPERFIDESGQFRKDERCIPFLVGKRYCLGQQLAQHELFLFLTGLLQGLSFSTPLQDPSMVNIEPVVGFMHSCPDYNVVIQART